MTALTTKRRNKLPKRAFAGPDRTFPVPDKSHAANAKARAKQLLNEGKISQGQYDHIVAAANRVLAGK